MNAGSNSKVLLRWLLTKVTVLLLAVGCGDQLMEVVPELTAMGSGEVLRLNDTCAFGLQIPLGWVAQGFLKTGASASH
jgi:hypothetical protein